MSHRTTQVLVRDLHAYCDAHGLSPSELARKTDVPQSTVHRILYSRRSNRITPHLKRLCDYANISIFDTKHPDPTDNGILMSALREVWDGTEASAQAIAKMLLAARDISLSTAK